MEITGYFGNKKIRGTSYTRDDGCNVVVNEATGRWIPLSKLSHIVLREDEQDAKAGDEANKIISEVIGNIDPEKIKTDSDKKQLGQAGAQILMQTPETKKGLDALGLRDKEDVEQKVIDTAVGEAAKKDAIETGGGNVQQAQQMIQKYQQLTENIDLDEMSIEDLFLKEADCMGKINQLLDESYTNLLNDGLNDLKESTAFGNIFLNKLDLIKETFYGLNETLKKRIFGLYKENKQINVGHLENVIKIIDEIDAPDVIKIMKQVFSNPYCDNEDKEKTHQAVTVYSEMYSLYEHNIEIAKKKQPSLERIKMAGFHIPEKMTEANTLFKSVYAIRLQEKKDHLIDKANLTPEQKAEIKAFFTKHPNYESKIDWNNFRDLEYEDFLKIMNDSKNAKSAIKKKANTREGLAAEFNLAPEGSYKILKVGDGKIFVAPLNHEGAQFMQTAYGINAHWCIGTSNDYYWRRYVESGDSFMLIYNYDTKTKAMVCIFYDRDAIFIYDVDDESYKIKQNGKYFIGGMEYITENLDVTVEELESIIEEFRDEFDIEQPVTVVDCIIDLQGAEGTSYLKNNIKKLHQYISHRSPGLLKELIADYSIQKKVPERVFKELCEDPRLENIVISHYRSIEYSTMLWGCNKYVEDFQCSADEQDKILLILNGTYLGKPNLHKKTCELWSRFVKHIESKEELPEQVMDIIKNLWPCEGISDYRAPLHFLKED